MKTIFKWGNKLKKKKIKKFIENIAVLYYSSGSTGKSKLIKCLTEYL